MKTVFFIGQAFTNGSTQGQHTAFIDKDGSLMITDPVTGHKTSCHALSDDQQQTLKDARPYSTVTL